MDAADADRWVAELRPGESREVGGTRLLALARGVLVVGEGGRTALWAPDDDELPAAALDAVQGAALDAAVLGLRPDRPERLARTVAVLRRAGALAPDADLLTLGDRLQDPRGDRGADPASLPDRTRARLTSWGVGVVRSSSLSVPPMGASGPGRAGAARRTVVLGAAASGKSAAAEDLLAAEPDVVYAATGPAPEAAREDGAGTGGGAEQGREDAAWAERVRRHRERRPVWWLTVEDVDVPALLAEPGAPVLLDSLGTWVSRSLGRAGAWDDDPGWTGVYEQEVEAMVRAWRATPRRVVAVGEETGWGVVPSTRSGGIFRDALGTLTRRLADESERVLLVVAGRVVDLDALARAAAKGSR